MNASEILHELVAIPTPSAVSNFPLLDWVTRFVEERDWSTRLFPYNDENGVAKGNLLAWPLGASLAAPIDLAFVCHTDTVPFADTWKDALILRRMGDEPLLRGCGACDVKGALASFLAMVDGAQGVGRKSNIALILTADEEIGCKGMEHLLASADFRIRSAIVSEPTSLCPGIAGKGYGLVRVTVLGIEAHSAYPREGVSAIRLAAQFIAALEHALNESSFRGNGLDPRDDLFDPPRTTVNVGTIQGGTAKNIVAGNCSFLVEWRPIPGDPPTAMLARLDSLAAQLMRQERRARIELEALRAEPGFAPAHAGPLRQRLAQIDAERGGVTRRPMGISFGSEASRLARTADEVIVIGPGDMHTAHSDRECVPVAELDEWTETLRKLFCEA